jgi:hypothetical protein
LRVALAVASMSRGNAMLNHSGNGGREDHQLGKKAPTAGLPARLCYDGHMADPSRE